MVIGKHKHEILMLIENTDKPDFVEFDRQLDLAEKAWGDYDELFARLDSIKSLKEFKITYKAENPVDTVSQLC